MALSGLKANEIEQERGAAVRHLRRQAMLYDRTPERSAPQVAKALRQAACRIEAAEHRNTEN